MVNENKFVPVAPKTYEVRYLENENEQQQGLAKIVAYLPITQIYCLGGRRSGGDRRGRWGRSSAHTVQADVSRAASEHASTQSYRSGREGRGCVIL